MGKVGASLSRKLGPLPAWAWLVIFAGAAYLFQRRGGRGAASVPAAVSPGVEDNTGGGGPGQVLQPGESYYDPGTGKLVTAPPGGTGGDEPPDPGNGGGGGGGNDPGTKPGKWPGKLKPKFGKRTKKPKTAHKAHKGVVKPHLPGAGRRARATHRPDSGARGRTGAGKAGHPAHGKSSKPRGSAPKVADQERGRTPMPRSPSLRQRPAAPRVVHQNEQKVAAHPARVEHPPAVHPSHATPAPRRAVAAKKRR